MVVAKEVVGEGMEKTKQGRSVMEQIVTLTNRAKDMVTQIARAAEDLNRLTEHLQHVGINASTASGNSLQPKMQHRTARKSLHV